MDPNSVTKDWTIHLDMILSMLSKFTQSKCKIWCLMLLSTNFQLHFSQCFLGMLPVWQVHLSGHQRVSHNASPGFCTRNVIFYFDFASYNVILYVTAIYWDYHYASRRILSAKEEKPLHCTAILNLVWCGRGWSLQLIRALYHYTTEAIYRK